MKWMLAAAAAALLASCAGGPEVDLQEPPEWELRPGAGYVNTRTMDRRTPDELYALAAVQHDARRHLEAAQLFRVLAESAPDPALKANSLFMLGQTLMVAGAYAEGYRIFEAYQARYPDGELATRTKQRMMDCALGLARVGQKESVLGIPMITSSRAGIDLLKATLQRFPREDFSDDYYFKLAEFHHGRGELDDAELELRFILVDPTYKRSNSAPRALLLLGRIGLERYDGVSYDHKTLADAKRAYEQFEVDYKRLLNDPARAAELGLEDLAAMLAAARAGIEFVNDRLAAREYALAEYYLERGHPQAARVYLAAILKTYPRSTWAKLADTRLRELEPTP